MNVFSRIGLVSAMTFVAAAGAVTFAGRSAEPPHPVIGAIDGHVFSLTETRGGYVALHFLPATDAPECAAFVREYLREAAGLAGVRHVFIRPDDAATVKAWASQFSDGAGTIHVDAGGALAKDLNVSAGPATGGAAADFTTTIVLDPAGKEVLRYAGKSLHDHLGFGEFAARVSAVTKRSTLADYNVEKDKPLAVEGYDVVAYFTKSAAVKGKPEQASLYRGVTYRFATPEDRALFAADPEKYLPTYGGWCASAMGAKGTKVEIEPTNFKVKDGRLFLFYKSLFGDALKDWNKNEKQWEPAADSNWKKLTGEDPGARAR